MRPSSLLRLHHSVDSEPGNLVCAEMESWWRRRFNTKRRRLRTAYGRSSYCSSNAVENAACIRSFSAGGKYFSHEFCFCSSHHFRQRISTQGMERDFQAQHAVQGIGQRNDKSVQESLGRKSCRNQLGSKS